VPKLHGSPRNFRLRAPDSMGAGKICFETVKVRVNSEGVAPDALALVRWGLRFADAATEKAFLDWHRQSAVPFTRIGMVASLIDWMLALVVYPLTGLPGYGRLVAVVFFGPTPIIVAALLISYRPKLLRWMLPLTLFANLVAGPTIVSGLYWIAHLPQTATVLAAVVTFFAFTIFRLLPWQAAVAALPSLVLEQWLLIADFRDGRLGLAQLTLSSSALGITFVSGLLACAVANRVLRNSYRQERIIEAQREAIERERARADVAERSRALAEAMARLSNAPRAPTQLSGGEVIDDRYRVMRALGKGGMGQVHEVERIGDGRRLALKVLTSVPDREALIRFAREAQIAAAIDHPNVVAAIDVGVSQTGMPFIVMELVGGGALSELRARFGDVGWALPVVRQIAAALATMHAQGIVHRDLKPSNVLLDGQVAKVADFGIATLRPNDDGDSTITRNLTRTGAFIGTPLYMAPELIGGARAATPAADVWSLGVIAYQLISGRAPFAEPPVLALLSGRAPASPTPLGGAALAPELAALMNACLSARPEARPTAEALAARIALA
jgi:hypothetical protein